MDNLKIDKFGLLSKFAENLPDEKLKLLVKSYMVNLKYTDLEKVFENSLQEELKKCGLKK